MILFIIIGCLLLFSFYWNNEGKYDWTISKRATNGKIFNRLKHTISGNEGTLLSLGIVGAASGLFIWVIASMVISAIVPTLSVIPDATYPLTALSVSINEPSYLLRSTSSKGSIQYSYIYESEQGYHAETIPGKNCYIKYVKDNFRVERCKLTFRNKICRFLFSYLGDNYLYRFYIPEGSIVSNYTVDIGGD